MNKILCILLSLLVLSSFNAFSQAPVSGVQWGRLWGTDKSDGFTKIIPANDGGYLLVGVKETSLYNEYGFYFFDLWLVKVNKDGYMEWQKSYGGSKDEIGYNGMATADNGFFDSRYYNQHY